jgi:DNA-binding transcriptional MerR regulator
MDDGNGFLRVRDLVERTGLPEADVKRYLRTFGEFFTSRKQGRTRLYAPGAEGLLRQIAELEAMGTAAPSIRGILSGGPGPGGQADQVSVVPGGFPPSAGDALTLGALSDIRKLQEDLRDLRAQVAMLREKVAEQDQKVIGHQQQIRLLRYDVDEQKTDALARRMEGRNSPFWKRIFP